MDRIAKQLKNAFILHTHTFGNFVVEGNLQNIRCPLFNTASVQAPKILVSITDPFICGLDARLIFAALVTNAATNFGLKPIGVLTLIQSTATLPGQSTHATYICHSIDHSQASRLLGNHHHSDLSELEVHLWRAHESHFQVWNVFFVFL